MKKSNKKAMVVFVALLSATMLFACSSAKSAGNSSETVETASFVADFYKLTDESRILSIDMASDPESGLFWTYEISDEEILNLTSFSFNPGDENGEGALWSTTYGAPGDKGGSVKLSLYSVSSLEDVETSNPQYVLDIDVSVDGRITVRSVTQ